MDFSGYLDVIAAGAGVMLLLSILDEAAVEFLKSLSDRKWRPYPTRLGLFHIGQRFWHAAVGRVLDETCAYLASEHAKALPFPAGKPVGPEAISQPIKVILAAAPADGAAAGSGLSAEGLANVKEENLMAALSAWLKSKFAEDPAGAAGLEARWQAVEPVVKSYVASRYQLMRKAYQNRLRLMSTFFAFVLAAVLSTTGQFSLYAYLHSLTRDPAARKAAAAWFVEEKNIEEYRARLGAAAGSLEEAAKSVERQADSLRGLSGPGRSAASAAKAAEDVKASVESLARRTADLAAATPPRALAALAEPRWSAGHPLSRPRDFLRAWLDILALGLLLSFGSENWHDILNAVLSVRRQFGGGAAK